MSDDVSQPGPETARADPAPATPERPANALAEAQQGLLERDLRLAELVREADALRAANAELRVRLQATEPWHPRHVCVDLKRRLKLTVAKARPTEPLLGTRLAGLAVALDSDAPRWSVEEKIAGESYPALRLDPSTQVQWLLDLPAGTEVAGFVALRPAAWELNHGGFDFIVELHDPAGTLVTSSVLAVDPSTISGHRRWLPWRVPLAPTGPHRLTLRTAVSDGASPDYAWVVVGDPRLVTPALAARRPATGGLRAAPGALEPLRAGRVRALRAGSASAPSVSLLLPVHDPAPGLLDRTLAAVLGQTDPSWQLCIVDDGSTDPAVLSRLERVAEDGRVRLARHEQAQGISGATNAALGLATSEFVATLDHDDLLAPDAVARVRAFLAREPETDFVYSDNDLCAGDRRFSAALKPDWSPDLLRAVMYTLHFSVYRRSVVEAVGGWRSAFDGAQDHDLVLRLSERTQRIGHLPRVLYHWRAHAGSASLGELAKPLAGDRGAQAIAEHLERTGHAGAEVTRLPYSGRYRVHYRRTSPVTVIAGVPVGLSQASLQETAAAILAVLRPDDRLVLAAPATAAGASQGAADDATSAGAVAAAVAEALGGGRVAAATAPADAGLAGDQVAAVLAVSAEVPPEHVVVLMEVAVAPFDPETIDALAGHVDAGAAAAGGVIGARDGTLLAGALSFPDGLPVPAHPDASLDSEDRHDTLTMDSNRLAVRGVVAISARELAKLRPAAAPLTRLALAGITLAAAEAGGRVVWTPHARFTASEPATASLLVWSLADAAALDRGDRPDPYWNPLRWADRGDERFPESVHGTGPLDRPDA